MNTQQAVAEERRGARPRVLIVEDEADIRELMRYNLEREGFIGMNRNHA